MNDLATILLILAVQITVPLGGGLLLSRRRDPAAACIPLVAAMCAVIVLTPLVFLPRPVWPTVVAPPPTISDPSASIEMSPTPSASSTPGGVNVLSLLRLAETVPAEADSARPNRWSAVAVAVLALEVFGLFRFALGWFVIGRAVYRSRPMSDPGLLAVADELWRKLGCKRSLAVRESPSIGSAVTVGWLRPVILLTPEWRAWTPEETRAVLAHEIAHIGRGDFVSRLIARLAVALHGYHPLVRWVASSLELRQEMAADAQAAIECGGRPAYLKCLAALALKADNVVGPIPTFLSRPRTLLRRIAMLSVKDDITTGSRRWPALAGVSLLALVAALGLHGTSPQALADPPKPPLAAGERERPPLDISYVLPSNDKEITAIFAVRLGLLARSPELDKFGAEYAALIPTALGKDKKLLFSLADVEQVSGRLVIRHEPEKPKPNGSIMLSLTSIRMAKEFDWIGQLRGLCTDWKEHTHADTKYYSGKLSIPFLGMLDTTFWFYLPDSRTLVVEDEENIKTLIAKRGKPIPPAWAADWATIERGAFGMVMTDPSTRKAGKIHPADDQMDATEKRISEALSQILSKTDHFVAGFDIGKTCQLNVTISSRTKEDAEAVAKSCDGLIAWAEEERKTAAKAGKDLPARVSFSIRRGVDFEPQFRHQTGVRIEFKGGIGDLVKGIQELMQERK